MPKSGLLNSKMQSLLERGRAYLTPTASSQKLTVDGFTTVKAETALFPKPDPKVDGDECLHDCATCTIAYPKKFSIDEDDKLYGHVNGWDTHLIVGTGKTDWVRDVANEKGSVMQAIDRYGLEYERSDGRGKAKLRLSASNLPTGGQLGDSNTDEGSNCLLLPSWQLVEHVRPAEVPELMREVIERSVTNKTPLKKKKKQQQQQSEAPSKSAHANGTTTTTTSSSPNPPTTTTDDDDTQTETEADLSALTLTPSNNPRPMPRPSLSPSPSPSRFLTRTRPIPHSALILMCSHRTRDARCGQSAPLLRSEFERHLRPLGLYRDLHDERPGGVGIYFINHVGGHKYSANVIIYRKRGSRLFSSSINSTNNNNNNQNNNDNSSSSNNSTSNSSSGRTSNAETDEKEEEKEEEYNEAVQGIWLARVLPADCENIVRYTVLQGKVVKPESQLRGGFDRERGLLSW